MYIFDISLKYIYFLFQNNNWLTPEISPFLSENVLTFGYPIKTILEVHVLQYTSPVIFQWTCVMYTHIQTHTYVYFYTRDGGKLKKKSVAFIFTNHM